MHVSAQEILTGWGSEGVNTKSLKMFVQPPCAIACLNICAHVENDKSQTLAAIPLFGHTKIRRTVGRSEFPAEEYILKGKATRIPFSCDVVTCFSL